MGIRTLFLLVNICCFSVESLLIVPQAPFLTLGPIFGIPQFYAGPNVDYLPKQGPLFTPKRSGNKTVHIEPATYSSRLAARTLDLCYFLGNDIENSHVACNENWADGTSEGVKNYINELTFETNRVLGANNLRLSWKGPFVRHDAAERYPKNPSVDTLSAAKLGCDAVVFLVFNEFEKDCETGVNGHKYGGISKGGMCEAGAGSGYTVVVDQGFLEEVWTGPQILAHHLLKMLIDDIKGEKTCPNKESLLYPQLYPGKQKVDRCAVKKLNQSGVSLRPCMQN